MFQLETPFSPCGDQPAAIANLLKGLRHGKKNQTLLGITGSGKTFTMANVIQGWQRPTLILAHNKTLAAQLYQEFKGLFPHNAVEYFVSYYDYYQPEAYIARTDTYIEKDLSINKQVERMRLSATRSLIEREDVIVIASVSCIYGLGMPENFISMRLKLEVGQHLDRDAFLLQIVGLQYTRGEDLVPGNFRVRGDRVEIFPSYEEKCALCIEWFGDEIERIILVDPLTQNVRENVEKVTLYPNTHHLAPVEERENAIQSILKELEERVAFYDAEHKLLEKERIHQRTKHDLEMIREAGHCKGIENYSRHFDRRPAGSAPCCLLNYFPKDYLVIVDESHQTLPQIRAMRNGDKARKFSLVEHGFRLPSAYDNRPLSFEEFCNRLDRTLFVSATPGEWEINQSDKSIVEQVIRPTGLLDPQIVVRPSRGQVDDAIEEIRTTVKGGHRVLVTVLTKKLAEELCSYVEELGIKAQYLHSDVDTVERVTILNQLRTGQIDVIIGINLLREGLDLPEVALVLILDADREGFLRSKQALIQTCGRAARNEHGWVIMYAEKMTDAMRTTIDVTNRRRTLQAEHNKKHGIVPKRAQRKVTALVETEVPSKDIPLDLTLTPEAMRQHIIDLEKAMQHAAKNYRFEDAARYRDRLMAYRKHLHQ